MYRKKTKNLIHILINNKYAATNLNKLSNNKKQKQDNKL